MNKKKIEKREIRRWWDYKRQLRWKNIYNEKNYSSLALNNRKKMILDYVKKLKLKKIKILEIGFGGGQLAYELIKKGNNYEGIDISTKLTKVAKLRCKSLPKKNFSFKVASIEKALKYKNSSFDLVIVAGVFQYSLKPKFVFKEIHRVMKKNAIFICAQTNFYKLQYFLNLRSLLIRAFYIFTDEQLEISNSLRSLFLETRLKKILNKNKKKFISKSDFFNKNFQKINFKFKKRVFYRKKIINFANFTGFKVIFKDACGPYLNINYEKNFYWFINSMIEMFSKIFPFRILKNLGESQIIVLKK